VKRCDHHSPIYSYHDIGRAGLGYRNHRAIPSIQETREINEKAEEIHERKFQEVKKRQLNGKGGLGDGDPFSD